MLTEKELKDIEIFKKQVTESPSMGCEGCKGENTHFRGIVGYLIKLLEKLNSIIKKENSCHKL